MLVCSGGGVFSPWRRRHTPHGAYPKPTPGYDVIFAILRFCVALLLVAPLSLEVLLLPCFSKRLLLLPPAGWFDCLHGCAFGKGLQKDLFSQMLRRKVFSLSWIKTLLSEQPKRCWWW